MKLNQFLRERLLEDTARLYDTMLDYDSAVRAGTFESSQKTEYELCGLMDCLIDMLNVYRNFLIERWGQEGCVPWYAPEPKKEG